MKDFKWKDNILIVVLVLLIVSGVGYRLVSGWQAGKGDFYTFQAGVDLTDDEGGIIEDGGMKDITGIRTPVEETKEPLIIHIVGAVKNPGVFTLQEGDRVLEAVEKAGGFSEDALRDAVNLAARIYDGQQIYIPREGEEVPTTVYQGIQQQKININTASQSDLETLPGIGPAKAGAIIQDREKNGPFKSIEEISRVTGIGEKTLEGIRDFITI